MGADHLSKKQKTGPIRIKGQEVPEEFATLLRSMRARKDPRLAVVLQKARDIGWTGSALACAVGVTRQAIHAILNRSNFPQPAVDDIAIPTPPHWQPPDMASPRQPLTMAEVDELKALQQATASIRGSTPASDPRRADAVRLAALVVSYHHQRKIRISYIAEVLGVRVSGLYARLARYGHNASKIRQHRRGAGKRLSAADVADCRRAVANGTSISALTRHYGVGSGTIAAAVYGKTWSSLTDPPPLPLKPNPNRARRVGKLNEAVVAQARRRYVAGETKRALAAAYGVGEDTIREAIHGVTWSHVTDPPPVPR